jgi:hypothetical protein
MRRVEMMELSVSTHALFYTKCEGPRESVTGTSGHVKVEPLTHVP